jgi:predicted TIM-barrel fold metal-dependent hydrolase
MTPTFAKADHGTAMTNETTHVPAPLPLQGMRVIIDAQVHLNHLGIEACLGAMDAVGIDGAIIDQYPPTGTRLENGAYRYSYAMSDEAVLRYPARFSYVARIDNRDPDRDRLIAEARSRSGCLGLRVDQPSPAEMADGGYSAFFRAVMEYNVPTWVVLPGRLNELHPYLEALPELPLVIDHAGLLERAENSRADPFRGVDSLNELARYPNVAVKWGHVTEWSAKPFPYEDALDQLRRVVDAFGASRVMWESDWTQTLGYQTLAEMFFSVKLSRRFSADEKAFLLGRTALQAMRWARPEHEVDTVVVGADVWDEFLHKQRNAGRLPHGRVKVLKAGEQAPVAGRTFSTTRLPNATTVAVDKLVEAVLFGRIARVD